MARVAIVGGGIAGLAAAHRLTAGRGPDEPGHDVTVYEAAGSVGGKIRSSGFAGCPAIDEGADAFLARVPDAVDLARAVGLGDELVAPEPVGAAVWFERLHDIPDGLLLGVPGRWTPIARSRLLSWRGTARAAVEPLLPRTSLAPDSVGALIRARFGDEVQERLVDALVGSIYATDTDRFSLAEVPQLHALATRARSLLLGARAQRSMPGTASAAASPIFAAPRGGVAALTEAIGRAAVEAGADVRLNHSVDELVAGGPGDARYIVDGERYDSVILAVPARDAASVLVRPAPDAAAVLGRAETADVVMVTLHVPATEWPDRLRGRSGYLVPKPVQRFVTAASFASQKWAHWRPPTGGEILRVSLGRDGRNVRHLSDDDVVSIVLDELHEHLGIRISPTEIRITRWENGFAQYRPHHASWVRSIERRLPAGIFVTGAGFRGIGIPACVRDGRTIAERAVAARAHLPQ